MKRLFIPLLALLGTSVLFLVFSTFGYGAERPVMPKQPDLNDLFEHAKWIIFQWRTGGVAVLFVVGINLVIGVLKMPWCNGWFGERSAVIKRAILITLGLIGGILLSIVGGVDILTAIGAGLMASNVGAVALFEHWKAVFRPKKEPLKLPG